MAGKRRKATAKSTRPIKKQARRIKATVDSTPTVPELYRLCVIDGDETQRLDNIKKWEERGALAEIVYPFLASESKSKDFHHACHLLVLFVSHHFWEGSFGSSLDFMKDENTLQACMDTLLFKTDKKDFALQTQIVHFLIVALSSNNQSLQTIVTKNLTGINFLHWMPERRRQLELKKSAGLRRKFAGTVKTDMWTVQNTNLVLHLLEGHSEFGMLVKIKEEMEEDADEMTMDVPKEVWNFIHRSLELLTDMLSNSSCRLFLVSYLESIHFNTKARLAVGHHFAVPENLRLVQHLLGRINRLMSFPIEESTQKHLSKVDVVSMHHGRATILQKMAHRHYPTDLQPVIYAGVGLLCASQKKNSYLQRAFTGFADDQLQALLSRMCLIQGDDSTVTREFMLEVLADYLSIPPYPMDQLREFPLYPTESMLWDHSVIPPSSSQLRTMQVLALPKLNSKFLSFQDYLLRNFELVRLESAYEIRSDLVSVVKRVRPLLRQSNIEDSEEIELKTEFAGWSRMSIELAKPVAITEVQPPKLGETVSARVTAEIVIDLERCGDSIRKEWDEIGEFDNLFLVAIDSSKMNGNSAPLLKDYHLHHGAHKMWDSDDSQRRVPDDEDSTFPQRFGITMVRGCMVLQVRNEAGTVLSEPGAQISESEKSSTKRIFKVSMDSAQYALDRKTVNGTESYKQFNLLVRRHGRENNFKSVLETIRGLMEGAGSIERVIPPWLQSLVLGSGDPTGASFKSPLMREYAMNTVGVNKPSDFLDFGDTFLDEKHLQESFVGGMLLDGKALKKEKKETTRCNFKLQVTEELGGDGKSKTMINAVSLPFPQGVKGNSVRFTPLQVEAIHSGLSPGLTMVVGPPGTGKTDVAVQIIASLHHSFPTQRTLIITHSNAALNDIFSKVMARGDVDERYLVRLGAGERELETESSHDFTKIGRVAYSIERRTKLLEKVQVLSESLGISGKAQRGADGSPSYTCESAAYFYKHQLLRRRKVFESNVSELSNGDALDVSSFFPFSAYFETTGSLSLDGAMNHFIEIDALFEELAEYRPYEVLRSQRQRADYLITKQARIVAMTCTHAAIARSALIKLNFEYDNIVMEESGQMMEIETFIPFLLQQGSSDASVSGLSRLKRVCMLGDHNQLPPVVKNSAFSKFSNLDQSLFTRLIKLGVPYIQLDKQGRARPELMQLYAWRYNNLGNLGHVLSEDRFKLANPGFVHTKQLINVEDFEGSGESTPTPYYYQNLGEAEYVVALFQYMVLIGHSPDSISIITTYNGQKELILDVLSQRCGVGTPLEGIMPRAISTVDQYQGQQNDIILLSLVRTKTVGHLRDIRRLIVAVSRARLGLYIFCRKELFSKCHELKSTMEQFEDQPNRLQLVLGETVPPERVVDETIPSDKIFEVEDVSHLGSIVHAMQEQALQEDVASE